MRYQTALIVVLCLAIGLAGCSESSKDIASSQDVDPVAEQQTPAVAVDTDYYSVEVPPAWDSECSHEVTEGDSCSYILSFYHNESREAGSGGWLFSIELLTEYEDYTHLPDYEVLGSIEVYRVGGYNIVVTYPTDVQCTEESAAPPF